MDQTVASQNIMTIDDERLRSLARDAAAAVWNVDDRATEIAEPFEPVFAAAFVEALDGHLRAAGPLVHRVLEGAARGAEGTNVEPFHGIVEVVQNADDQRAGTVRIALRDGDRGRQMLLAHDGEPVTFRNVAGMVLPYLTTKEDDPDQRGRFGIGLKTLRRISDRVAVHSGPYHFGSGAIVSISNVAAEPSIRGFFDADADTLLVLDLAGVDEAAFASWFEAWNEDALIFLDRVRRVSWHRESGVDARSTRAGDWVDAGSLPDGTGLMRRDVAIADRHWTVHRAELSIPPDRSRAHKRTGATTPISVATSRGDRIAGLFVGFPTRVPTAIPFVIDAQFDPSTSREAILDNAWNAWLIEMAGEVLAAAAESLLRDRPQEAWRLLPLPGESIGDAASAWPRERFDLAFAATRELFGEHAVIQDDGSELKLSDLAYEEDELSELLDAEDAVLLSGRRGFVGPGLRDNDGRWRKVLDALGVAARIGADDVIRAAAGGAFAAKAPQWWTILASTVAEGENASLLLDAPVWLRDDGRRVVAGAIGSTSRLLVLGDRLPAFSAERDLLDRLHPEYGRDRGRAAVAWLRREAAFATSVSGAEEILAFVGSRSAGPAPVDDTTLQELRALLDPILGSRATELGARLGEVLLLDATDGRRGSALRLVRPAEAYLPKSIDKDNPNWPGAAADLPGMWWVSPGYEERLRTGLGRARLRGDGVRPRAAKSFLSLVGVGNAPRLTMVERPNAETNTRRSELQAADANSVPIDWRSEDLERVLVRITGERGRDSVRARRERAVALLKSLAREWKRYAPLTSVGSQKVARVRVQEKRNVTADWVVRLREAAWMPVGRSGFRRPGEVVIKNASTSAVYDASAFLAEAAGDVPDGLAEALGLVRRVRASDVVATLEAMRAGEQAFDRARVRMAYRQLSVLAPAQPWQPVGDMTGNDLRARFIAGGGLVVVEDEAGRPTWRRPDQVLRGKRVLPSSERYVPDGESYARLWRFLNVPETRIEDCCAFLKEHARRHGPDQERGAVIDVYRHLDRLLAGESPAGADLVRHLPLDCGGEWWARRPVLLVEQDDLRASLAAASPDRRFWNPPCRPATIPNLVSALSVTRLAPSVVPDRPRLAEERGEETSHRFQQAVTHLSDQLATDSTDLRDGLTIGWERLKAARLLVHEDYVAVDVNDCALPTPVRVHLQVHLSRSPLELHATEASLGDRHLVGRAVASLFVNPSAWNYDAEWALAWQNAAVQRAEDLHFVADQEEERARLEREAEEIRRRVGTKGKVDVKRRGGGGAKDQPPPAPLPPRRLKASLAGVVGVTTVAGGPPGKSRGGNPNPLRERPTERERSNTPVANTSYGTLELEDAGWAVAHHLLDGAGDQRLVDFRNRQRVGADGAIDWRRFVELKSFGRTMPGSVELTAAEYGRAVRAGREYLLVMVAGLEEGMETRVKIVFDPVKTATVGTSEKIRLSGLAQAAGIEMTIADEPIAAMVRCEESAPSVEAVTVPLSAHRVPKTGR